MSPSYTLYAPVGSFRALPTLISAAYNDVTVGLVTENIEEIVAEKSPINRGILLAVSDGPMLFSPFAIARFVAGLRADSNLLGKNHMERAVVESWIDWGTQALEIPSCILWYPKLGFTKPPSEAEDKARIDLRMGLGILNRQLQSRRFVASDDQVTLADISLISTLLYAFRFVCDKEFLSPYSHVVRWFETCVHEPPFVEVLGPVHILEEEVSGENTH